MRTDRAGGGTRVRAVLSDRDGTLVEDVPHSGDPGPVRPMRGAPEALDAVRAAGPHTAVVGDQRGVARGLPDMDAVRAVNARVLGPADGCARRTPAPGLVPRAAPLLGVAPQERAVIGDIGADVGAARAAGARAVPAPPR